MTRHTRIFSSRAPTPWHLWLVAVLALFWNAVGAFDYVATQTRMAGYMDQFSQLQLDYFYAFPSWVTAAWAIAVWSAVAASLALLFRSRFAYQLFWLSLIAMGVTSFYNFVLTNGAQVMGTLGALFSGIVALIAILLLIYSRAMVRRRVLS